MLLSVCTCMVLLYSIACLFKMHVNKNILDKMMGMVIVMIFVTFSSVTLGVIFGVYFSYDITVSTIVSIVYGIGLGYLTGKSVSLLAILEGIGAGTMGGMMGAMLGNMLLSNFRIMIIFMTVLLIIITSLLAYIITLEASKKNGDIHIMPRPDKWMVSATLSTLIIFAATGFEENESNSNILEVHDHSTAETIK